MSVNYSPKTPSDGLQLAFDAANKKCYSGSGTSVANMLGGAGATLVNGPTWSVTNQGVWNFDGSNDYADFSVTDPGGTCSIEVWARMNARQAGNNSGLVMGWNFYAVGITTALSGEFAFTTGNNDWYGLTQTQVINLGLVGNWKHYILEMRSDVSYTNNKIYVNGVSQSLSQITGFESSGFRTFNSGNGRIASWRGASSFYAFMDLGIFKIYNRSLTQAEILTSFNALRGRYGV